MMLTLKTLTLVTFLTLSSAMASTVNLGSVFHLREETRSENYNVTILSARTTSRTTDANSKLLGQWENCFTRYKNVPYTPFQKYMYVSLSTYKDSTALVSAGERALLINDALIADLKEVSNELTQKTEGKCKLETTTRIEYLVEMKDTKAVSKSEVWISIKGNALSVTYAKWVGGKLGFSEVTDTLPNKVPVEMFQY